MSTLVTLGCSFSQGDGCYDFSNTPFDFDENFDFGKATDEFYQWREDNMENFLNNSIGSNIQEKFGYEKYMNYAYAGSSNESQMLLFFNQLPQDDNVTVIWQQTFYHRKFQLNKKKVSDAGLHFKWVVDSMNEKKERLEMDDWDIDQDNRFETLLRINIMNEYCQSRGWKFLVWTWVSNEYDILIEMYPKLKHLIIPFKNPFDREMNELPKEWVSKLPNDAHPNEVGYKIISDGLCESIIKNKLDCPILNEIPKDKIKIHPTFITL